MKNPIVLSRYNNREVKALYVFVITVIAVIALVEYLIMSHNVNYTPQVYNEKYFVQLEFVGIRLQEDENRRTRQTDTQN